jgi:photosystem II stability/assembly factor-like uncharacterized protein
MKWRNLSLLALVILLAAACNPFTSSTPAGIIKTANGGGDWQFANKLSDNKGSLGGLSISQIAFDPKKSDRIFASSYNSGLFVSEDGGNTWRQILSRFTVYDFVVDPNSSDIIYAAGIITDHGRVLATRDGGKSWVEIFNEASTQNPVRAIALNPDNNQELVIGLGSGTVIKSQDAGVNWKLLQKYPDRINRVRWQAGSLYVVVRNAGLYRSTDGGASFDNLASSLVPATSVFTNPGTLISPVGVANFNQVAISQSNPDTIYLTTSSGLFQSFNRGDSWTFVPLPLHQRDLPAQAVAIAPSSDNVVYTSVGSAVYKTSDGGNTWQAEDPHTTGLINALTVHPTLPQQAFAGIYAQ